MIEGLGQRPMFRAAVGNAAYDAIRFSRAPKAEILTRDASPVAIIRHDGLRHDGIVSASNAPTGIDTLLFNTSAGGRYRGRVGGDRVDFALQRGQMSFVPGTCTVDIEYPAANSVLLMMLPQAVTAPILAGLGVAHLPLLHATRHERLGQLFLMVEREMTAPGFASDLMIDGLLRAIVTILTRPATGLRAETDRLHLSPVKLKRAQDFIEAELGRTITLAEIAAVAGLSPFHFSRVFKLATGETPYRFVGLRRLARARDLLAASSLPLAEIALACGFASQSHFTAAFTKGTGMSPGRFRRQAMA